MKITVLLVVYNCESYISECIQSILNQSYTDFELLVIDDGSIDRTVCIIDKIKDKRIRLLCNKHDYIESLNLGLREAKGKYIARIDGDDIMTLHRLKKQVDLMENHPNITVCASWMKCFGLYEKTIESYKGYVDNAILQMLLGNIISHPTVMIRKSFIELNTLFYKKYPYAEDYKLWCDIAINGGVFWVIPEVLLHYRCSNNQISHLKEMEQQETTSKIQNEILEYLIEKSDNNTALTNLYEQLSLYNQKEQLSFKTIVHVFYEIFLLKNTKPLR